MLQPTERSCLIFNSVYDQLMSGSIYDGHSQTYSSTLWIGALHLNSVWRLWAGIDWRHYPSPSITFRTLFCSSPRAKIPILPQSLPFLLKLVLFKYYKTCKLVFTFSHICIEKVKWSSEKLILTFRRKYLFRGLPITIVVLGNVCKSVPTSSSVRTTEPFLTQFTTKMYFG